MSEMFMLKLRGAMSIGIVILFMILAIWIIIKAYIVSRQNIKHDNDSQNLIWTKSYIKNKILSTCKTGRDFELFLYRFFILQGYKVELTQATNDKGKDLILKERKTGKVIFVEAKRYASHNHVGREVIQKLLGACNMYGANEGYVITTSNFTNTAIECLKYTNNLELWDMNTLITFIEYMNIKDKKYLFNIK